MYYPVASLSMVEDMGVEITKRCCNFSLSYNTENKAFFLHPILVHVNGDKYSFFYRINVVALVDRPLWVF